MLDSLKFEIPEVVGTGTQRRPQEGPAWPAGTVIVDVDAHWLESDLWVDRFPPELKHRAPRMTFKDNHWDLTISGKSMNSAAKAIAVCEHSECIPGIGQVGPRLLDMDAEGIDKHLMFPQRLFGLFFNQAGDLEMREPIFSAYNEYMALEVCSQAPDRLYFVGIPNYWDVTKSRESIQEIKALGARALMVPLGPRTNVNGEPIAYNDPNMDPFWAAVEESGLPLCFHIGENFPANLPGATHAYFLGQFGGFRTIWGTLVFSGLFDRHPGLRIVFVEGGISFVAGMLNDADMLFASYPATGVQNPISQISEDFASRQALSHSPSWYWHNHCYATFMVDPAGLEQLHRIGSDRVMWAADYPHSEGTYGYTRTAVQQVFDGTPDIATAQMILGKTAIKLFNMT